MFSKQLLADVTARAQDKIKQGVFRDAAAAEAEIAAFGQLMAKRYGAIVARAPTKSEERASQKVAADYGGDWHQIKDVARMTIIVPTLEAVRGVLMELRRHFQASRGGSVMQVKDVSGAMDPCGYSSTTVFVRTTIGRPAEIQVNIPQIIYAKQSAMSFIKVCGPKTFLKIKTAYQMEGGLGHALYEIYRVAPLSPAGQRAAAISRSYYDYFRNPPGDIGGRKSLLAAIASIKATHAHVFAHH